MESPALRHKNRILEEAAKAAAIAANAAASVAAAVVTAPAGQAARHMLDVMLAALATAQSELKNMNSLAERYAAKKGRYLPQFEQFIADYLAAGEVYANPVLVWFTLWLFDIRDMERALHFADICIAQHQEMPEQFSRDMQTFAADEVLEWAETCHVQQQSASPYFDQVLTRVLSGEWVVHEKIQARFAKLAGEMAEASGNLQGAIEFWKSVQRILGGDGGVKTRIATAEKALARASEGSPE